MIRTTGFSPMGDRYEFDFRLCTSSKGWAQLDTRQDASYYGNWINPITFEFVSHCEGDQTHIKCESKEEFIAYVHETVEWHRSRDYFIGIDGMCNQAIIAAFTALNLHEYLH
jgi:hypothetical protein